jgi:Protein of unknown function (DUF4038)/Putative collagen-binding domain of a collagenase
MRPGSSEEVAQGVERPPQEKPLSGSGAKPLQRRLFLSGMMATSAVATLGARPGPGNRGSGAAFPLRVSDNRRYLVDAEAKPFFLLGDTPWFLQRLPIEDARRIMDDRKAKGFNTLFLEILDDSRIPSRDAHGSVAFQPETDITRPVEAYWKYADAVLDEAASRGFFVIMSDLWYGYGNGLWMHHVTPESARVYGHFLGNRYKRFTNLMWMHCGDRNPNERLMECTRQLARAMKQEAPGQLHTAHLAPEHASSVFFANELWLDVNLAYTYGVSCKHVLPEYQRTGPVRPVFLGETGYQGEPNSIELLPDAKSGDLWTPYLIRRNAYWAVLSGAFGYCAGTRLWRYEPNWRDLLDAESSQQAPMLLRLMESMAWWRLIPDTKHEMVIAGYGTFGNADYVTAALADDGSFALAYVPNPRDITVDLGRLKGRILAHWFDPTNGKQSAAGGDLSAQHDKRSIMPPGRNAAGDRDFVLVLQTAG